MGKAVAVLGGGHGGHCMAADLALAGYQVNFYEVPEFAARVEKVLKSGEIKLTGIGRQGVARLNTATTDMGEALAGVDLINIVVPAYAHGRFFREMLPYLRDGQTVVLWAADFGSLELWHFLRQNAPGLRVRIVEANTLPYGTRMVEPGWVDLPLMATLVTAAALPAVENEEVLPALRQCFPVVRPADDVLSCAFSNPNPIVHPPGSLLNVGRIQFSGGDFYMYREGITEAVARVIRRVFAEVKAVAQAYGTSVIEYEERDFNTTGSIMAVAFQAPFDTLGVIARIKGPSSIYDRYITEDLPQGLVPIAQLGRKAGVATPVTDAIVSLGAAVCGRDFWSEGRTLAKLGVEGLSVEEIRRLVRQGL
ncbi:MAG: NAD/NADP octopine/nopaline dehydrogenase family protein [Bacillota bacterium]